MRLLALDQSSRCSGWAIFDNKELIDSGTFTLYSDDIGERLVQYRQHLSDLIDKYKIEEIAFEDIQMQNQINNVQTFKVLAEIFGITQEYLVEYNYPYHIVSSNTWKSKLQIKGRTRQEQKKNAQAYVLEHYNKKVSQDEADAISLGTSVLLSDNSEKCYNWG